MTLRRQKEAEVFGATLRELRTKRRLTQGALANKAGLIENYISDMERGLKVPSLTTLLRLAAALDCKVTSLVAVFDKTHFQIDSLE